MVKELLRDTIQLCCVALPPKLDLKTFELFGNLPNLLDLVKSLSLLFALNNSKCCKYRVEVFEDEIIFFQIQIQIKMHFKDL